MMARVDRRPSRDGIAQVPWRWPVDLPATLAEHRGCAFDVRIIDLSLTGCRLWAGFRLTPGRPARITVEAFAPFDATIVWSENWYAALRFRHPLHPAVLRHLVTGHPAAEGEEPAGREDIQLRGVSLNMRPCDPLPPSSSR